MTIKYRSAQKNDAPLIAQLHIESWQSAYRGILSDAYLDKRIYQDRLTVWSERMARMPRNRFIIIAFEAQTPVGFICVYGKSDTQWGALIDNLHVLPQWKGKGIGKILMQKAAIWVNEKYDHKGIFLWVYEANLNANAFYQKMGGQCVEKVEIDDIDGSKATVLRYIWTVDALL